MTDNGKVVFSEVYTKGVIAFFMIIILMAYSASLYFLVKVSCKYFLPLKKLIFFPTSQPKTEHAANVVAIESKILIKKCKGRD